MKFWNFRFEGKFEKNSSHYGDGLFSNCLVPEPNFQRARSMFLRALKSEKIELIEIIEYFSVDGDELDAADESNAFWIDWYRKTVKQNRPTFDKLHVYDLAREN